MKDNFSKRRFYLNKKEKTNFHNRNNAIEKNDNINIKNKILNTEINDEKELNLKTNLNNRSYFRRNYGKTEPEKLKVIENYILFENKNELKQKEKEEINPKRNYFNHFRTNKIVLNPNEYVNTTYKFNYNNNTNSNLKLKKGKFSKNNYNRSLENIKKKAQKAFESFNSEQNIDMIDDLKKK